jgi:hypothetical protein
MSAIPSKIEAIPSKIEAQAIDIKTKDCQKNIILNNSTHTNCYYSIFNQLKTINNFNTLRNNLTIKNFMGKAKFHVSCLLKKGEKIYPNPIIKRKNSSEYQVDNSKFFNSRNILLNNIKNIINENNINNDTHKLIELEIHDYNMKLFNENNNIWKDLSKINKDLKDLIINSKYELMTQIKHLKNKNLHSDYFNNLNICNSFYNENQKNRHSICISKILSKLDVDKIISILLGKVLFIINNPKLEESYATKIFNELGTKIKQSYFYALYVNERNKKLGLINYQGHYYLCDWKNENREFVKYFEDELFCIMLGSFCVDWLRNSNLLELDTTDYVDNKAISYIKFARDVSKNI